MIFDDLLPPDAAVAVGGNINHYLAIKKGGANNLAPAKPKEPPIELNIKAKKPDVWVPINTYEAYVAARKNGLLISYRPYLGDDTREYLYPQKAYTKAQIEQRIQVHHLAAHSKQKVQVYTAVQYEDYACLWYGKNYEDFQHEKVSNPGFIKQLQPLCFCIFEGVPFV